MSHDSASETTSKSQPKVVVDAAHPLFLEPDKKSVSCSTKPWKYHCLQCDERLTNKEAFLKKHFEKTYHERYSECQKCKGSIYEYLDHNSRAIYHKCRKNDKGIRTVQDMNQNYTTSTTSCNSTGESDK